MDKFYGGLLRFCPRCGMCLSDVGTNPDVTKRWLRCRMCGYAEPKVKGDKIKNPKDN